MSTLTINVAAKPLIPPVVSAGADQLVQLPQTSKTINGTATDDGTIVTIQWTQINGPSITISGDTTLALQLDDLVQGSYTFKLAVTDDDGLTTEDHMNLVVISANQGPNAIVGSNNLPAEITITKQLPYTAGVDDFLDLIGINSNDPDGAIVSYQWLVTAKPAAASPTFNPSNTLANTRIENIDEAGAYTIDLVVTDNKGDSDTQSIALTVNAEVNVAPTVTVFKANAIGDITTQQAITLLSSSSQTQTVRLYADSNDANTGDTLSHVWSIVDNGGLTVNLNTVVGQPKYIDVEFVNPGSSQDVIVKCAVNDGTVTTEDQFTFTVQVLPAPINTGITGLEIHSQSECERVYKFQSTNASLYYNVNFSDIEGSFEIGTAPGTPIQTIVSSGGGTITVPTATDLYATVKGAISLETVDRSTVARISSTNANLVTGDIASSEFLVHTKEANTPAC